jgi:methylated-DNA-[protein]-cysteine S-methyltransferase
MMASEFVQHYLNPLIGWLELRVSQTGVRSISFVEEPTFPLVASQSRVMKQLVKELDGYFVGRLTVFSVPLEDQPGTVFQRQVWEQLRAIPYGEVRSYSQVAAAVGRPKAARAVGSANGKNIVPLVIPCHRVLHSDGSLGGYSPGLHIKKRLLELEGVDLRSRPIGKTTGKEPALLSDLTV